MQSRLGGRSTSVRIGLLCTAVALMASACGGDSPDGLAGMVREPNPFVGDVALPDTANDDVDFPTTAADGEILVVYFGYTTCPDVCPTTMADLRSALGDLGDDAERVSVAMVTIDPNRDTPDKLANYVHAFFDDGHSLRSEDAEVLKQAADAYGASFSVAARDDGLFDVEHSAFLYVVDSTGHLVVQWPFGMDSEDMAKDLRYIFDQAT